MLNLFFFFLTGALKDKEWFLKTITPACFMREKLLINIFFKQLMFEHLYISQICKFDEEKFLDL